MIRVTIIESPYAAPTPEGIARNRRYLDACILDCIRRGETPYASHKMLTDALNDANPEEREIGIAAGFKMRNALLKLSHADGIDVSTVVYTDIGVSDGMRRGVAQAEVEQCSVQMRELGGEWAQ